MQLIIKFSTKNNAIATAIWWDSEQEFKHIY